MSEWLALGEAWSRTHDLLIAIIRLSTVGHKATVCEYRPTGKYSVSRWRVELVSCAVIYTVDQQVRAASSNDRLRQNVFILRCGRTHEPITALRGSEPTSWRHYPLTSQHGCRVSRIRPLWRPRRRQESRTGANSGAIWRRQVTWQHVTVVGGAWLVWWRHRVVMFDTWQRVLRQYDVTWRGGGISVHRLAGLRLLLLLLLL